MEVTQTDKAITLDCGCNTSIVLMFDRGEFVAVQGTLNHCPLHVAAPKLLAALEAMLAAKELHPQPEAGAAVMVCPDCWEAEQQARAAIEEANK